MLYSRLFVSLLWYIMLFFFKQKRAYEMRISDWSSDVCSSDLVEAGLVGFEIRAIGARGEIGLAAVLGEIEHGAVLVEIDVAQAALVEPDAVAEIVRPGLLARIIVVERQHHVFGWKIGRAHV